MPLGMGDFFQHGVRTTICAKKQTLQNARSVFWLMIGYADR
jgi:hypothetical protein